MSSGMDSRNFTGEPVASPQATRPLDKKEIAADIRKAYVEKYGEESWNQLAAQPAPHATRPRETGIGILWICYHALKASEWKDVRDMEHRCAYCNRTKLSGHDKDCMIGYALKSMREHIEANNEPAD